MGSKDEAMNDDIKIPEGFTAWPGGDCPVSADAEADVLFRNGARGIIWANAYSWTWLNRPSDIIAYRVVEP